MMRGQKPKTLIVEDSISFRQLLKEALLSRFPMMEVLEAGDGAEALKRVKAFSPDLAIIDIQLPRENGLDLTKILKAEYPNLKVIVLTIHDAPEYREAAYQSQANYFISKGSSTKEEILVLIQSALSRT
ncbi:MAG: response regulator receiver protein [Deltaproteobacteria bacterium]|jgi:DNA-binding NarL/FixJ family response regulator|nr:response regulator receiver protein [Deltaproteobacteria bacterium]